MENGAIKGNKRNKQKKQSRTQKEEEEERNNKSVKSQRHNSIHVNSHATMLNRRNNSNEMEEIKYS